MKIFSPATQVNFVIIGSDAAGGNTSLTGDA